MSEANAAARIPEWDVADRMRKALRESSVGVQEIADYLGVTRGTVSSWINGRITPSRQTLRLWALKCGVRYEWIKDGALCPEGSLARDSAGAKSRCTRASGQSRRLRIVPALPSPGLAGMRPVWCAS